MRAPAAGDFSGLAEDYALHRPDYSPTVLRALIGLLSKDISEVDFVDVGAGTGIWTRMVSAAGVRSAVAIEPNDDMRNLGAHDTRDPNIAWHAGSAENTGLDDASADWITMASSFHWANFKSAVAEFHRILRPLGRFTALWNPRLIEVNPLLAEIEAHLTCLEPNIKRVSSGRSGITDNLTEMLLSSDQFEDVIFIEGRHVINMTAERYLGIWRSVNDVRVQLGPAKFQNFLEFVENRTLASKSVEVTYLTRAWSAQKVG